MSPIENEIVRKKIAIIIENLKILEPINNMNLEQYTNDIYKRKATERLLQELIEAAIDINTHIIVQTDNMVPDDYYESFIKLGALQIIPIELAEKLAPSTGLRNRLVHEYDSLKNSIVLQAVNFAEKLFPEYINAIMDYISKK